MRDHKLTAAGSTVRSGFLSAAPKCDALSRLCVATAGRGTAHITARRTHAFTLVELLVTTGVLVVLVFLASQLFNSAATVTSLGHKQMDADAQARQLLDRMAIDFAQMVKRADVDYYVKSSAASPLRRVLQPGNDRIAFYSAVPGYYPTSGYQSPVSLVAYRVNSDSTSSLYNKMERLGKGLLWNAATPTPPPVVFIPIPLASPLPVGELPSPTPNPLPNPAWPEASSATTSWSDSELIGSQVFRFEYYYLLKGTNDGPPIFTDIPWDTRITGHTAPSGMQDVAAVVVDIAVIDSKSKVLLTDVTTLAASLSDYNSATMTAPGQLRASWQNTLDTNTTLPRPAISGIRLYERYFYLTQQSF